MSLLSVSALSFQYSSAGRLFENVSFAINPGDRIAIVGPNGAGKSTLLQLIAGRLEPAAGSIARRRELTIATAEQEVSVQGNGTLFDLILEVRPALAGARRQIAALEREISDSSKAIEYAGRIHQYQESGGYEAETDASRILAGLGFASVDMERPISELSGGERTRASLARALSTDADLLILDEPTNHLDITARAWLAESLAARTGASILTSHDRAFLGTFAQRIVEIDRGVVRIYEGGYAEYARMKALLDQQAWAAYDAFQRRKRAAESAAERRDKLAARVARAPAGIREGQDFYARKSAKVARTGRILRERVRDEKAVPKPWEESKIGGLTFDDPGRGSDFVLVAEGLSKSYGERTLFRKLSFHVRRGDRLAITGANGSGKTTLLKLIEGSLAPDEGSVRCGAHVEAALITQTLDDLDPVLTPLEICGTDTRVRTLLACLKVRPECLNRPVREMSGGERTKVALARTLSSGANLMLLDEPTNHLEIEAQEALEEALRRYPGTVIVVSHDRAFLDALGADLAILEL